MDPYAILGIKYDATDDQIKKAYWKKAKKCHPDKNLDNLEEATEKFKELTKALELLTDGVTRTKYDDERKAKEAARKRREELDRETKKLRDQLEEREKKVKLAKEEKDNEKKRQNDIKRMKEEGKRLLEEEQERCRKRRQTEIQQRMQPASSHASEGHSGSQGGLLKLNWSSSKNDPNNGGYSEEVLRKLFSVFGSVKEIMVSTSKKGRGMVEFQTKSAALNAAEIEKGLKENPLKITLVSKSSSDESVNSSDPNSDPVNQPMMMNPPPPPPQSHLRSDRDFESLVMMRLRQAEERKRLIEQMKSDETDG